MRITSLTAIGSLPGILVNASSLANSRRSSYQVPRGGGQRLPYSGKPLYVSRPLVPMLGVTSGICETREEEARSNVPPVFTVRPGCRVERVCVLDLVGA